MKTQYTLNIKLTLVGPILTAGGEMSDPGIDAPMARDRHGRFMLPFSLIKGKVLDAVSELKAAAFVHRQDTNRFFPNDQKLINWLGLPSSGDTVNTGSFDPDRGRLHFSDFHTDDKGNPDNIIDRIQIDPDSGTVKGRMLQMIQAPFGYGQEVCFEGFIEFVADEAEASEIRSLIDQSLRWVPAFGAYRTIGFGRTRSVRTDLRKTASRTSGNAANGDALPMQITLDRPLCVVGRKHSSNHFDSLEVISGTVLKGAVARMLQEISGTKGRNVNQANITEFATLRSNFEKIRFAEARPMKLAADMRRPIEPPLSVATSPVKKEGQHAWFDAALEDQPRLINDAAPAFRPDWKDADFGTVRGAFGWSLLPKERRTRTAISPFTGRAADEQLFSYGLVLPDRTDSGGQTETFVWDTAIGLESVDSGDQEKVRTELESLLKQGITGIGKTRAVASITWLDQPAQPVIGSVSPADGLVIITLQTECLMTNPEILKTRNSQALEQACQQYWESVSKKSLSMMRFFACQSLYGGFVSRRANQQNYEPFLLTERGSTFVLKIEDNAAANLLLAAWKVQGLPTADWVSDRYAPNGEPLWQRCPYIRENGYGAIAINLRCHTENRFP